MRHARRGRKLNRTAEHRTALRRNLVQSLIEHGRVRTTLPKAKETQAFAEKVVGLAIEGSLAARQRALRMLNDRQIIPKEHREEYDMLPDAKREKVLRSRSGRRYRESTTRPGIKFTAESVLHRLFAEIGPKMKQRNEKLNSAGGYTRIIKLAERRLGDAGEWCYLELVSPDDEPRSKGSDRTERKRRAKVKYAAYAGKPIQRRGARKAAKPGEETTAAEDTTATAVADAPTEAQAAEETKPAADTSEPQAEAPEQQPDAQKAEEDKKADEDKKEG